VPPPCGARQNGKFYFKCLRENIRGQRDGYFCSKHQQKIYCSPWFKNIPQHRSQRGFSKCHAISEIICSWQNHTSARAWGKSRSAAVDSQKQPHIPTPGIKMKSCSYNISVVFFFKIYLFYISTLSLSSDTPEEGIRPHYGWLWATMWLLGIELRTSGRAASALNHWAISPAPFLWSYCCLRHDFSM